jgi:hypothetical protein
MRMKAMGLAPDIHRLADLLRLLDRLFNDQSGFIHCQHERRTPD